MKFPQRNSASARLTVGQVLEIRDKYNAGMSQGALCREYQVSIGQIGRIVRGESWQKLPTLMGKTELNLSAQRMMEEQIRVQREREANINPDNMLKELKDERRNEEPTGIPPDPLDE